MTPRIDPAAALRARILLGLGLGLTTAPGCWLFVPCEGFETTSTVNLDAVFSDTADTAQDSGTAPDDCPTDEDGAEALLQAAGEYCNDDIRLVEQSGRDCTYVSVCPPGCCGYGRPYLDDAGIPVKAETVAGPGWDHGEKPEAGALTTAERAALGACWLQNARAEHSSVAGFHRFALDLLANGAPAALLARAQRAAAQELRHAIDCFSLASTYLGEPVGPAPMDMGGRATIATSLAQLAAWTARDGAIGETIAAYLAEQALADTTDPAVRAVLNDIVRDETEHAELAWATIQWAIDAGGDEVREAVRAAFADLRAPGPRVGAWTPPLARHGVPSPLREQSDAATCIADVILPVAEAMLSRRLAA